MMTLTQLGYQILELIQRKVSLTRDDLSNSLRIPDRDLNMSLSFYEQQDWIKRDGDKLSLTPIGQSYVEQYRRNNPKALPAISLE